MSTKILSEQSKHKQFSYFLDKMYIIIAMKMLMKISFHSKANFQELIED